jgi:hypothetical protein
MKLIDLILAELNTPTGRVGPLSVEYGRATGAIGHAVLGSVPCAFFGAWGLAAALPLAGLYWLAKERGDLRRGGDVWDGLEDAVMVSLGAWYGVAWWPALLIGAAGYIMASAAMRAK